MSSIDFDEVLVHVGEKGRYQNIMYYLLCIPATLPAAFLAFSQVFVSASPEHWCRIPELDNLTDLMSLEERKALSLPYSVKSDGRRIYSKCHMYDVNYTEIIDSWLEGATNMSNTTDSPSLTTSPSFDSPSTRLPLPPVSSPDWPIVECRYGWNYDTRDYDSTLVTEKEGARETDREREKDGEVARRTSVRRLRRRRRRLSIGPRERRWRDTPTKMMFGRIRREEVFSGNG